MLKSLLTGFVLTAGALVAIAQEPSGNMWFQSGPMRVEAGAAGGGGVVVIGGGEGQGGVFVDSTPAPSAYWLGIHCDRLSGALQAQLNLPEKQGLVVLAVVPDSPAAKANIERHDVLLRAGDKTLADPRDIVEAVENAKDKPLKLELIRGGKPQTIEATPAKRPENVAAMPGQGPPVGDWSDADAMRNWMLQMMPGKDRNGQPREWQYRFFRPGAIISKGADVLMPKPLPADTTVVITREGEQPAKIVVKRGKEEWKVSEKELDKLPDDLRPHIERMLSHGPLGIIGGAGTLNFVPEVRPFNAPVPPGDERAGPTAETMPLPPQPGLAPLDGRLERRLDAMDRRIDKLLQAVERMVDGHGQHKPAADTPTERDSEQK